MKIVAIFGEKLYAFCYKGQKKNELRRLLDLWNDPLFVYNFLKANERDVPGGKSIIEMAGIIRENAKEIDNTLRALATADTQTLGEFFKPLHNQEYSIRLLSLQKAREQYLRLYAIRIDKNCFVITGGAIKLTHLMEDKEHTREELNKLNKCRDYLKNAQVFDTCSFHELLNEL